MSEKPKYKVIRSGQHFMVVHQMEQKVIAKVLVRGKRVYSILWTEGILSNRPFGLFTKEEVNEQLDNYAAWRDVLLEEFDDGMNPTHRNQYAA